MANITTVTDHDNKKVFQVSITGGTKATLSTADTYVDKDIKQEKSYRYFVIPYNKYNWISDNALTIKTYYSLVDWIE